MIFLLQKNCKYVSKMLQECCAYVKYGAPIPSSLSNMLWFFRH